MAEITAEIWYRAEETEVQSTHMEWHVHPEKGNNEEIRNLIRCFENPQIFSYFFPPE